MNDLSNATTRAALATRDVDYLRGVALVLLAGVLWSIGGVLVRWVEAASAWQIIFYRSFALALTLVLVIAIRHRGRLGNAFARAGWSGLLAGACLSGGFMGFIGPSRSLTPPARSRSICKPPRSMASALPRATHLPCERRARCSITCARRKSRRWPISTG
jgi:hypothetical protein